MFDFWSEKQTDEIHSVATNVLNLERGQERDVEDGWMDDSSQAQLALGHETTVPIFV